MPIAVSPAIRDRILSIFDSSWQAPLLEFAKFVANLETDYTVCMARKAARLLDLLALAGCPTPARPMTFHHILEQDLSRFAGKSVTLVDDTLILGTTLGNAERILKNAGVSSVKTVVFAVDKDCWNQSLVTPDQKFLSLSHTELLTFCSTEVHALGSFAIPYLTDFPFMKDMRITRPALERLQSLERWETVPLRPNTQANEGASCYSAAPADTGTRGIERAFGEAAASLVNLSKVRIYSRLISNTSYWTRLVPIATLSPLREKSVQALYETVLTTIESACGRSLETLRISLTRPKAQLRFAQYMLSAAVGKDYFLDLKHKLDLKRDAGFSIDEGVRLFGPWLRKDITDCHHALDTLMDGGTTLPKKSSGLKRAELPIDVAQTSESECRDFVIQQSENSGATSDTRTILTDLERIFLRLHERHELAARDEVRKFGKAIFDLPPEQAPHRDRLEFGFDWPTVARCVFAREGLQPTPQRMARLSFLLDALIDTGIAVPLLCEREGIFFRAYRHGEDVPFANQEFALAYDVAAGFLEASEFTSIPQLTWEKLLVSLLRVGVAKKFLIENHGLRGAASGVARIGFHLHGAVATMPSDDSLLADHQESWLSRYLVDDKVMRRLSGGRYALGARPEAALITRDASTEAQQLGYLLGTLSKQKDDLGISLLPQNDLTVLATCVRPRDVAVALAAELNIILDQIRRIPRKLEMDPARARKQHAAFVNMQLYTAMNSARMKYFAHNSNRAVEIVKKCEQHFETAGNGPFIARYWRGLWEPILAASDTGQKEHFATWIEDCWTRIMLHAQGLFIIEFTLASQAAKSGTKKDKQLLERCCKKIINYFEAAPDHIERTAFHRRLLAIAKLNSPIEQAAEAFSYGLNHNIKQEFVSRLLFRQIVEVARDYGRTDERFNYQYVLWYDIIDSTGQKSGLQGDALRSYRNQIRAFKERIIQSINGLSLDAQRRNVSVYCWANALASRDDEKNIFFRGPRALDIVNNGIAILINEARAARIRVRALAIDTTFAGEAAHKYASDPTVEGEAFWEHGSRLKQGLKRLEAADHGRSSYLWLGNELAKRPEKLFAGSQWTANLTRGEIDTTIENYPLSTRYAGGSIVL